MQYTQLAKSIEWETPDEVYIPLHEEFSFTLDPCASKENHKTVLYFTEEDNGLSRSWQGHSVFMNPPYGKTEHLWMKKAYEESQGDCLVVGLLPVRTGTRRWWDYIHGKAKIRFVKGRISFKGATNNAPFDSAIIIWRTR